MPLVLTGDGAVGPLSATEVGFLDGVTSSVQSQINTKANDASLGLYFIASQSFSASTAVNVNNCFTSTYDWYRILLRFTSSATADINLRLRLAGTDASGSDYVRQLVQFDASTVSTARSTAQTGHIVATGTTTGHHQSSVDVFSPAIATPTTFSQQHGRDVAGTAISHFVNMGGHNVSTAYDGFSLIPASGTITGTVRVYGYRNS